MPRAGRSLLPLLVSVALAIGCWLGASRLGARTRAQRQTWPVGEGLVWLPPPRAASIVAIGYRELWADINWSRLLVYYGSNWREDVNYRFRYLTRFLDNIIALDPRFKRVYEWASYSVTFQGGRVEPEEYELSVRYLERAMQVFPDHWRYFWLAGIRYYIDLKSEDPAEQRRLREHGARLIEQAMHKPDAPDNLALLAAGLRTELGQQERALDNLRQIILTTDDPEAQETLIRTYRALAGKEFPEEATRAKEELQRGWMKELPFAPPNMYVALGDRPAATFDMETLAAEQDLLSTLLDEPAADEGTPGVTSADDEPAPDAPSGSASAP